MSSFTTSSTVHGDGQLLTPDSVLIELPYARVGSRAIARLIDEIVVNMLWGLILWVVIITALSLNIDGGIAFAILLFVLLFLRIGIVAAFNYMTNGGSPGKMIYGLRIISRDGSPASFRQFFIREILGIIEVSSLSFISVIASFLSKTGRRIGDIAGDTIVIHQRGNSTGKQTGFIWQTPPELENYVASIDVGRLDEKSYAIIRQYLIRCPKFAKQARGNIALTLAQQMSMVSGVPLPSTLHPELFLLALAAKTQRLDGMNQYQGQVGTPGTAQQEATQGRWANAQVNQVQSVQPMTGFGAVEQPSWQQTSSFGSGASGAPDMAGATFGTPGTTPSTLAESNNSQESFVSAQQNAFGNPLSNTGFAPSETNTTQSTTAPEGQPNVAPSDFKDPFA